jgi:hypothetical protein
MEYNYAFIKDQRVINVLVFGEPNNTELIDQVKESLGADLAISLSDYPVTEHGLPAMYWSYVNSTFEPPTEEYLISIGVLSPTPEIPPII